jgi:hypothetical protein
MARRVDNAECRRVVSVLIKHTTPDSWLMDSDNGWPWLGEWLRRAVLCIHWQRKRIEDLQAQVKRLTALLRQAESDTALLNRLNAVFEDNAYIAVDDGEGEVRCSATEYADFDEGAVPLMSGRECLTAVVEQLEHREAEFYRKLRAEAEFGGDG